MKLLDIILENNPSFEVKGINLTYTDFGKFYAAYLYPVPLTTNLPLGTKKDKMKFDDASEYIKGLTGLDLPERYEEDILDNIVKVLNNKGFKASHNDAMDIS